MPTGPFPGRGMSQPFSIASQYSTKACLTYPSRIPLPLWLSVMAGHPGLFSAMQ